MGLLKFIRPILFASSCIIALIPNMAVNAAGGVPVPTQDWSFSGVFGTFDRGELQRGFHVYKEVCAGCHSLNYISFRNLVDLGFNEEEIKVIAKEYEVEDGPNNDGEMPCHRILGRLRFQMIMLRVQVITVHYRQTCH